MTQTGAFNHSIRSEPSNWKHECWSSLCSGQSHIQTPGVVQEADALVLIGTHT